MSDNRLTTRVGDRANSSIAWKWFLVKSRILARGYRSSRFAMIRGDRSRHSANLGYAPKTARPWVWLLAAGDHIDVSLMQGSAPDLTPDTQLREPRQPAFRSMIPQTGLCAAAEAPSLCLWARRGGIFKKKNEVYVTRIPHFDQANPLLRAVGSHTHAHHGARQAIGLRVDATMAPNGDICWLVRKILI